ncbi:glucosaminidase domain-containing protein [Gorillibacterium timonense]|uniref:glucosaminidase domain-containing protein n=1 Tax=Gorillibacterium timonense TaxID=1689269 RepID=UPI00071C201A|nr:glucosaminidase domain-containing protein [Gorillibacterium timonense]
MTRQEFIATIGPIAVRLRLEGSPVFASLRVAQSLIETGGGIPSWNNVVGFKVGSGQPTAYWKGRSVNTRTWEVVNGTRYNVTANWRAYDSVEACFRDQDLLFRLSRYERVRQAHTPEEQAGALLLGGYATDPDYAKKLIQLIASYNLKRFDKEVEEMLESLTAQIAGLQEELKATRTELATVRAQLQALQNLEQLAPPVWAKEAMDAAVAARLIDTPKGSVDFYRVLTVLHRLKLFGSGKSAG